MAPRILFTDIDGTLLNKNRELSISTQEQIKRINKSLAVPVILVSARMPKSMKLIQAELNLSNELICYNGSLVLGQNGSDILHDERMGAEKSLGIIEMAQQQSIHYSLFANDSWMISNSDEWSQREARNTKVSPEEFDLVKFQEIVTDGIHKIMLMGDSSKLDLIQEWIGENMLNLVSCYRSKISYLEISPKESNKLTGMIKVLENCNIAISDSIAIGDHHNDSEMIKHAGIGVAVDNAPEEIKNIATFICPSNINDGVAFTIQKFF